MNVPMPEDFNVLVESIDRYLTANEEWLKIRWSKESNFYLNMTFKTKGFTDEMTEEERLKLIVQLTNIPWDTQALTLRRGLLDRDLDIIENQRRIMTNGKYIDYAVLSHSDDPHLANIDNLVNEIAAKLGQLKVADWRRSKRT